MNKCNCNETCCTCKIETTVNSDSAGRDGYSAKEIAIMSGQFFGTTDEEFIEFLKGEQGIQGIKGDTGDTGITLYTWFRYANDDIGTGISTSPVNKEYIGLAFNKTTNASTNNPSDYTWSKIKGEKGDKGDTGDQGIQGVQGIQGIPGPVPNLDSILSRLDALELLLSPITGGQARIWWTGNPTLLPEGWEEDIDYRGYFPFSRKATGIQSQMGYTSGAENVALTSAQNGPHDHVMHAQGAINGNQYLSRTNSSYSGGGSNNFGRGGSPDVGMRTSSEGMGLPHNNMPPYKVGMWIKYVG